MFALWLVCEVNSYAWTFLFDFNTEALIDSAIKASVAAAVTILLILVCVITDCASKWRIRQRIKKAAAAAANQGEPLLKNAENQEANEASSNEALTKKE